jgi:hypothetical protein
MSSMANLRRREHKSKDWNLDLLGEEFRMKICIELCRSLTAVEKGRVMSCDKSNSCSVPLGFMLFTQCCADQQVITKLRGKGLMINKGSRIVITFCPFGSRVPRSTSIKCYGRLQPRLSTNCNFRAHIMLVLRL